MEHGQAVKPADREVRRHERGDKDQATGERGVGAGHRGLQRIRHKQDEDQVVKGELADLTFAEDSQRHKQRRVDDDRSQDKLPGREAWEQ